MTIGEVSERPNEPVSKTGMPQGIEGSNPSLSAVNEGEEEAWDASVRDSKSF